jgi:hypothetical protein
VKVGMDTGLRAEIVTGLTEDDQVVIQPDPSMADGTEVQEEAVSPADTNASPKKGE